MTERSALSLALASSLGLAIVALVLRVTASPGGPGDSPIELLPLLFAAAGLCVAGLLRHRAPAGAWLAAVMAGWLAALETVGTIRAWAAATDPGSWPWLVLLAEAALVASAAIAGAYGTRQQPGARRTPRLGVAWRLSVFAAFTAVVVFAASVVAMAFADPLAVLAADPTTTDAPPLRGSGRIAVAYFAFMVVAGVWRDVAVPARRARARAGSLRGTPKALADELLPSQAGTRRRAEEAERARLAAELHARVLPDLRRAADAAEAAGPGSDAVAVGLRHAVEDVEALMHARQSVVLEEYGLVAALEWLAERTQARAPLSIEIELDGGAVDDPAAIPKPVARAAFRVALLALDNVVRHAGASRVVMRLHSAAGRLSLGITDDGRGIEAGAARRGGRGLADMRAAAADAGATVAIERKARGTHVHFTWPAAEDHRTSARDLTTGLEAPPG